MADNTCWAKLIEEERVWKKDGPIIASTMKEGEAEWTFDKGYGGSQGVPFTAWSENRVYFPVVYDGSEWVGSAPRNPCDEPTEHQGGQ